MVERESLRMVNEAILIKGAITSVLSDEGEQEWQSLIARYLDG